MCKVYLQAVVHSNKYPHPEDFCNDELFWKVVDHEFPKERTGTYKLLLEFRSKAARKKFVADFCEGKMRGKNYLVVKLFSTWKNDDGSFIPMVVL